MNTDEHTQIFIKYIENVYFLTFTHLIIFKWAGRFICLPPHAVTLLDINGGCSRYKRDGICSLCVSQGMVTVVYGLASLASLAHE